MNTNIKIFNVRSYKNAPNENWLINLSIAHNSDSNSYFSYNVKYTDIYLMQSVVFQLSKYLGMKLILSFDKKQRAIIMYEPPNESEEAEFIMMLPTLENKEFNIEI